MSDFRIELLMSEIKVVQNTEKGEHYIEASAEQIIGQQTRYDQKDMLQEFARVYTLATSANSLADCIVDIVEDSMSESQARGLANKLIGRYMR